LPQYESVGGFAPPAVSEAAEAVAEASAASTDSVTDAPAPSPTNEGQEVSLPQPTDAAEPTAAAAVAGTVEGVVGEAGSSPSRPVTAGANKVLVPDEPAAAL
jgi:hypothetical protein